MKENFTNWVTGNENIDDLIKEMQLKINNHKDIIFEWISYNKFENIEKINADIIAMAVWKDGPLYYDDNKMKLIRKSNKQIFLKYISQDNVDELLNKVY